MVIILTFWNGAQALTKLKQFARRLTDLPCKLRRIGISLIHGPPPVTLSFVSCTILCWRLENKKEAAAVIVEV